MQNIHPKAWNTIILYCIFSCFQFSYGQTAFEQRVKFFSDTSVINGTLSFNIERILKKRDKQGLLFPAEFTSTLSDGKIINDTLLLEIRGHFRRDYCYLPPLRLIFNNDSTQVWYNLKTMKLISACRVAPEYEEYILKEYLIYKMYNLITDKSFRVRLLNLTYLDSSNNKKPFHDHAFLLEDVKDVARRNDCTEFTTVKLHSESTDRAQMTIVAIFEYMIGNTDWSVQYLQNIKLLAKDSNSIPTTVPYDFDHAGIVDATYAKPAEELQISSTRQRMYRGYCVKDMKQFDPAIAAFNSIKKDIYSLYQNNLLLSEKYKKSTIKFLDEFYATINNLKNFEKDFSYPCDPNGTGNIIIKGLK